MVHRLIAKEQNQNGNPVTLEPLLLLGCKAGSIIIFQHVPKKNASYLPEGSCQS